jgi:hypothetical protein
MDDQANLRAEFNSRNSVADTERPKKMTIRTSTDCLSPAIQLLAFLIPPEDSWAIILE